MLAARCEDIGRDPKEITLSAHVRLGEDRDYAKVVDEPPRSARKAWTSRSFYLPPPYDPAVLEPLALLLQATVAGSAHQQRLVTVTII